MSLDLKQAEAVPITSVDELVRSFAEAEKPAAEHRIGLEHEKLVYPIGAAEPVAYEGARGIGALLERIAAAGHEPFREGPGMPVIALQIGESTISLEPGGQLELSGAPKRTAREVHAENLRHVAEVKAAASSLGLFPVALGYRPYDRVEAMPWMPKTRYRAMRETLGKRGRLALDMMLMTATGQVSLDWADEADCARKVSLTARMSPYLVALFANSPLVRGQPSGFLSYRSHVWTDVDPARCGFLPSMIDGTFSYRAYVEWALDAPLLFLRRGGEYRQPAMTFRQLLRDGFDGKPAQVTDWTDHLSTLFPEVRIKRVMEVRSADCVSPALTGALAALMRGVLYDRTAASEAEALLPRVTFAAHQAQMVAARKQGLRAERFAGVVLELIAIGRAGLKRIDAEDAGLLEPLEAVAKGGASPAEVVLAAHERHRDPAKVLAQFAI